MKKRVDNNINATEKDSNSIMFYPFQDEVGFHSQYQQIWDFLVRINQENVINEGFLWGRWEWMFSLRLYLDTKLLSRIGIWKDGKKIVGVVTFESTLGFAYLIMDKDYCFLKEEMLLYAKKSLGKDGSIKVLIDDQDTELQEIALKHGFYATQEKEHNSVIRVTNSDLSYNLPEGYKIVSLAEEFDLIKYNRVLWKGFNHGDQPDESNEMLEGRRIELSGPHVNLHLKVAVAEPGGNFVSYCGMWYVKGTDYALVEPVATDPDYRKMGLGKAAVLEGVKRCFELGAKIAYVGSSQQFYYRIGFRPCSTQTWWEYNN